MHKIDNMDKNNKINYNKSITDKERKILAYYKKTMHQDTILTIPIKTPTQKQIQKRRARTLKNTQTQAQYNIDKDNNKDIKDIDNIDNKKQTTHSQTKKIVIMD